MTDCDVLVVGGGPAGQAVALDLCHRGSLSVVVAERTSYERPRVGETLSPGARTLLDHLRVTAAFDADGHVPAYGTAAAWGSPTLATRDFLMTPFGTGWHLDRRLFDARLAEAAESAGAAVWRGSRLCGVAEGPDGFVVGIERGGVVDELRARFLVDASGKAAAVARRLGTARHRLDRQVAVAGTLGFAGDAPATESQTLVEACEHGWWYSANLPDRRIVVALVTDADLVRAHRLADGRTWWEALRGLAHTWPRVAGGALLAPPRVVSAYSACLTPATGRRWLAVGDAAASHDPLSASGIVRALESGVHAARAIHHALVLHRPQALADYDRRHAAAYQQYCATRAAYYQQEGRWPDAAFWRRRHRYVTLDPRSWLAAVGSAGAAAGAGPSPLPPDLVHLDCDLLLRLATPCAAAHEVAAAYQARAPRPVPDLDVVLALQWLLARGQLRMVPEPGRGWGDGV